MAPSATPWGAELIEIEDQHDAVERGDAEQRDEPEAEREWPAVAELGS